MLSILTFFEGFCDDGTDALMDGDLGTPLCKDGTRFTLTKYIKCKCEDGTDIFEHDIFPKHCFRKRLMQNRQRCQFSFQSESRARIT